MGKNARPVSPPPAKIFYESIVLDQLDRLDEVDKRQWALTLRSRYERKTPRASHASSTSSSANVQGGSQRLDSTTAVTHANVIPLPTPSVPPIDKRSAVQPFGKRGSATVQTIVGLIKEISQIFHQVPYVKAIAAIVEQIITISDVGCPIKSWY